MTVLIAGLLIFLGAHSLRIFADDWRTRQMAQLGEARWKGLYSLASALGLGLIVWGVGLARMEPSMVWLPPAGMRHVAALLTLPAFILLVAAYVPGNRIKRVVGQPMAAGVVLWAVAHLLSNGRLSDVWLFGGFLAWSLLSFDAAQRRDRAAGVVHVVGGVSRDVMTVIVGVVAWAVFAGFLHAWMIGLRPF
ncbi:MAG: NnrU family protein [Proteobacteria bacterium]|nr:NnrU family protein [Pseudomonadota bacterium]